VGKKELGGDPDFFSVIVLFSVGNFVYQMWSIEFLKLISATIIVFQIKQVALTCDLNLLDAAVLNLTVRTKIPPRSMSASASSARRERKS
jgi:hypothetical protein